MKTKRIMTAALLIFIPLAATFAAGAAERVVRLSEVVRSVFYAPQYVAINKGFFTAEGIRIELSTAWGADKGAAALVSGSVDIGFFGPEAAIYVFNQGAKNPLIAFAQLTKRDGSFLLARKPMPNFKWEDTRGKVIIGGRPGGVPEMVLEYILKHNGVEPFKDVEILRNLQFTATAGAFQSGLGDYIALFEPTVSQLERDGAGHVVASLGLDGGLMPYTVYHARRDYLQKNRVLLQKFTNAVYRGQIWVQSHTPAEITKEIMGFFPDTDEDLITRAVRRYKSQDAWAQNPILTREAFERLQEIIASAGELSKKVPYEKMVDNRFAVAAVQRVK